jgi:hypothetical protein
MNRIKIIESKSPERCEICHQADLFDPIVNSCKRCENLIVYESSKYIDEKPSNQSSELEPYLFRYGYYGIIFSGIMMLLLLILNIANGRLTFEYISSFEPLLLILLVFGLLVLGISAGITLGLFVGSFIYFIKGCINLVKAPR